MWLVIDKSVENITLLKKLGFMLPDGDLLNQELMEVETRFKLAINIELSDKNDSEYIHTLPENFLEQISLLESLGFSNQEIWNQLKELT